MRKACQEIYRNSCHYIYRIRRVYYWPSTFHLMGMRCGFRVIAYWIDHPFDWYWNGHFYSIAGAKNYGPSSNKFPWNVMENWWYTRILKVYKVFYQHLPSTILHLLKMVVEGKKGAAVLNWSTGKLTNWRIDELTNWCKYNEQCNASTSNQLHYDKITPNHYYDLCIQTRCTAADG